MGLHSRFNRSSPVVPSAGEWSATAGPTVAEAVAAARVKASGLDQPVTTPSDEVWGRPGLCPACRAPGYLDRIDLVRRVQFEHCPDCFHRWSVAESEAARLS